MKKILLLCGYHDDISFRKATELVDHMKHLATVRPVKLPRTFFQENILWYIMQTVDIENWDYVGALSYQYMKKCPKKALATPEECNGDCIAFLSHRFHCDLYESTARVHGEETMKIWDELISRVVPGVNTRPNIYFPHIYCSSFALKTTIIREYIDFMTECLKHVDILNVPVYYNVPSIPPDQLGAMGCRGNSYTALVFIAERLVNFWMARKGYSVQVLSFMN